MKLLNTVVPMPAIGFGLGEKNERTVEAILSAIEIGYRAFDTASQYNTEPLLGEALAKAFNAGLVKRTDLFVTTKINPEDNKPTEVLPALQKSLSNLQLDYVDLYLIHWPFSVAKDRQNPWPQPADVGFINQKELWQAMEACVSAGLTRAIGVSNWSIKKLDELLLHAQIRPAVNQVEMHPLWRQDRLRAYCSSKGIQVCAYSPLGAPGNSYGSGNVMALPVLHDIVQKSGKTPAQVILHWIVGNGVIPIVRSYTKSRQATNLDIFGWDLADEDIKVLDSIPEQKKIIDGRWWIDPMNGPVKDINEIWDE